MSAFRNDLRNAELFAHLDEPEALADPAAKGLRLTRGVLRAFHAQGIAALPEVKLGNGLRADVLGLDRKGRALLVEVKSSRADFRADGKWPGYLEYCDFFYFAVPADFPQDILPADSGLLIADGYGATLVRPAAEREALKAARRRALTLSFARQAARRLLRVTDPGERAIF